jgi:hypothetical protein
MPTPSDRRTLQLDPHILDTLGDFRTHRPTQRPAVGHRCNPAC